MTLDALLWLAAIVPNFPMEFAIHLQRRIDGAHSVSLWAGAALANPRDHLLGIRMPGAKLRADRLKTVAVHKEQKTDRQADSVLYILIL